MDLFLLDRIVFLYNVVVFRNDSPEKLGTTTAAVTITMMNRVAPTTRVMSTNAMTMATSRLMDQTAKRSTSSARTTNTTSAALMQLNRMKVILMNTLHTLKLIKIFKFLTLTVLFNDYRVPAGTPVRFGFFYRKCSGSVGT